MAGRLLHHPTPCEDRHLSSDGPVFHKYNVTRTDGKPMDAAFVLELKDPYAKAALRAYADACEATHPMLAADIRVEYELDSPTPATGSGGEA